MAESIGHVAGVRSKSFYYDPTYSQMLDRVGADDPDYELTDRIYAEPTTRVYFALDREAAQIKIGISEDVDRRVKELGAERGRDLELLAAVPGGYNLERAMHGRFRDYRVERNEWYSSEIVGELPGIVAA